VAIVASGDAQPAGPWGPARAWAATDVIGLALALGRAFGQELTARADAAAPYHPGRCAAIALPDGTVLGHAGELHPKVVTALDLPPRTCAAELDLDALIRASGEPAQPRPLSTYPVAHSDVALVVDEPTPAAAVEAALRRGAGDDLESVTLFDIYRGDQVSEGKKSMAYRLSFRSSERTLKTEQVSAARDAAIAAAAEATGAVQRA
jgi:phenylalanyl-tRNA synthetase beta chain